jgi:hypothetical protein
VRAGTVPALLTRSATLVHVVGVWDEGEKTLLHIPDRCLDARITRNLNGDPKKMVDVVALLCSTPGDSRVTNT